VAQPTRHWNTAADTERQEGAGDVNRAAVTAYKLSVQAGNPLSERKLAQRFGRTSRRWARARIAEARKVPSFQDARGNSPSLLCGWP